MRPILLVLGLVFLLSACASTSTTDEEPEPTPPPAAAPAAPPEPAPVPVVDSQPVEPPPMLPKTASSLPALGLTGLVLLGGAGMLRAVRRRLG